MPYKIFKLNKYFSLYIYRIYDEKYLIKIVFDVVKYKGII